MNAGLPGGECRAPPLARAATRNSTRPALTMAAPPSSTTSSAPPPATSSPPSAFFSHVQAEAGDTVHALASAARLAGFATWRDNDFSGELNLDAMAAGVRAARVFVHVLTDSVPKSWATCWEIAHAVSPANAQKRRFVLRETDPARGGSSSVADLYAATYAYIANDPTRSAVAQLASAEDLSAKLGKPTPYDRLAPIESLLAAMLDVPRPTLALPTATAPEITLACSFATGFDQAVALSRDLAHFRRVRAHVLSSQTPVPAPPTKLLLFITEGALRDPAVAAAVLALDLDSGKDELVLVHEGDGRRLGAASLSTRFSGDVRAWLADELARAPADVRAKLASRAPHAIEYGQNERKTMLLPAFLDRALSRIGLARAPFASSASVPPAPPPSPSATDSPLARALAAWISTPGTGADEIGRRRRGLVLAYASADELATATAAVRGLRALSALVPATADDVDALRSLAAQACARVPGFRAGFPATQDETERLLADAARTRSSRSRTCS